MRIWQLVLAGVLLFSSGVKADQEQSVVLISIDGFRWDYIEKHQAKHLKAISE